MKKIVIPLMAATVSLGTAAYAVEYNTSNKKDLSRLSFNKKSMLASKVTPTMLGDKKTIFHNDNNFQNVGSIVNQVKSSSGNPVSILYIYYFEETRGLVQRNCSDDSEIVLIKNTNFKIKSFKLVKNASSTIIVYQERDKIKYIDVSKAFSNPLSPSDVKTISKLTMTNNSTLEVFTRKAGDAIVVKSNIDVNEITFPLSVDTPLIKKYRAHLPAGVNNFKIVDTGVGLTYWYFNTYDPHLYNIRKFEGNFLKYISVSKYHSSEIFNSNQRVFIFPGEENEHDYGTNLYEVDNLFNLNKIARLRRDVLDEVKVVDGKLYLFKDTGVYYYDSSKKLESRVSDAVISGKTISSFFESGTLYFIFRNQENNLIKISSNEDTHKRDIESEEITIRPALSTVFWRNKKIHAIIEGNKIILESNNQILSTSSFDANKISGIRKIKIFVSTTGNLRLLINHRRGTFILDYNDVKKEFDTSNLISLNSYSVSRGDVKIASVKVKDVLKKYIVILSSHGVVIVDSDDLSKKETINIRNITWIENLKSRTGNWLIARDGNGELKKIDWSKFSFNNNQSFVDDNRLDSYDINMGLTLLDSKNNRDAYVIFYDSHSGKTVILDFDTGHIYINRKLTGGVYFFGTYVNDRRIIYYTDKVNNIYSWDLETNNTKIEYKGELKHPFFELVKGYTDSLIYTTPDNKVHEISNDSDDTLYTKLNIDATNTDNPIYMTNTYGENEIYYHDQTNVYKYNFSTGITDKIFGSKNIKSGIIFSKEKIDNEDVIIFAEEEAGQINIKKYSINSKIVDPIVGKAKDKQEARVYNHGTKKYLIYIDEQNKFNRYSFSEKKNTVGEKVDHGKSDSTSQYRSNHNITILHNQKGTPYMVYTAFYDGGSSEKHTYKEYVYVNLETLKTVDKSWLTWNLLNFKSSLNINNEELFFTLVPLSMYEENKLHIRTQESWKLFLNDLVKKINGLSLYREPDHTLETSELFNEQNDFIASDWIQLSDGSYETVFLANAKINNVFKWQVFTYNTVKGISKLNSKDFKQVPIMDTKLEIVRYYDEYRINFITKTSDGKISIASIPYKNDYLKVPGEII